MALEPSTGILAIVGLFAAYFLNRLLRSPKHVLPLPPGPKGLPLLGNLNDLPKPGTLECHHWLTHKDLYGPLSSITVLGQTFVIINDAEMALELLRNRANVNSGRPTMVFCGEMVGWRHGLGMIQPNEDFKLYRKNIAKVANSTATLLYFDRVQEEESAHFLLNVLHSPDDLFDHIHTEAGAVILRTTYGYTPEPHGKDPFVDLVGQTMVDFADAATPGRYMVDIMPFLRYLPDWCPGTGFKARARQMSKRVHQTIELPYAFVKQQMREKKHKTSYVSKAIEDASLDPHTEHILKWSAGSLYTGGADTTVSSLMTFFLAMILFPEVQKKAQEEIDRVIGNTRLPVSSDKEKLPYIEAVLKETHRWHPVGPMAIPHTSNKEDEIMGYRIPKGALLMPNTWWFTHDPAVYSDPMNFNPDRFLSAKPDPDPRVYTFGYGRRVCPGRYVADNALFITMAQALAVFDVSQLGPEKPRVEFEPGVISHPAPYDFKIEPRSELHRELVKNSEKTWPWGESDAGNLNMAM